MGIFIYGKESGTVYAQNKLELAQWVNETFVHFLKENSQLNGFAVKLFGKFNMEDHYNYPGPKRMISSFYPKYIHRVQRSLLILDTDM